MFSLLILCVIGMLVLYSIIIFKQLMQLKLQLQLAFTAVEAPLQHRYQQIQSWMESSKAELSEHNDTIDTLLQVRMTAAGQLKVAANNPGDIDAMQQLAAAESRLQNALEAFGHVLGTSARLTITQLRHELKATELQLHLALQHFNQAVRRYNHYKQSFPALLLTDIFGHQSDACLLEFANVASYPAKIRQGGC